MTGHRGSSQNSTVGYDHFENLHSAGVVLSKKKLDAGRFYSTVVGKRGKGHREGAPPYTLRSW